MSGRAGRGGEAAEGEIAAPMRTVQQTDTLIRFQITSAREGDRPRRASDAIPARLPAPPTASSCAPAMAAGERDRLLQGHLEADAR
jgi:hypothetical protein